MVDPDEQGAWTMVNKINNLIEERDALVAERDEAQRLYELFRGQYESKYTEWDASKTNAVKDAEAERDRLREALEAVAAQQPKTLAMIEANGFVFTDIGKEPGNWQHLAFSVYTDLCEVDTIARAALGEEA